MYLRYFGFEDYPFAVTPDPAFLYLSDSHRQALAHLLYGAGEHGGFVSLTGEVGTGKTTLIRALMDSDLPDLDIALCYNPQLDVREFVATICDELGVPGSRDPAASLKTLTDRLNTHLLEAHAASRRTVLIIDEAQNLSRDVLEQLRLLTNLETHRHKLLRIILVGQPELADLLARHDLRQLSQRINARSVLKPLGFAETRGYVQHRLECANGPQHLFTGPATLALRAVTGGVPRLINMVCERALMGAYAHGQSHIGAPTVLRAAFECLPRRRFPRFRAGWQLALPTGLLAAGLAIVLLAWLPDIPLTNAAEKPGLKVSKSETSSELTANQDNAATDPIASSVSDAPDLSPEQPETTDSSDTPGSGNGIAGEGSGDGAASAIAKNGLSDATNSAENALTPGVVTPTPSVISPNGLTGATNTLPAAATENAERVGFPTGEAEMSQLLRLWGVFGANVQSQCERLHVGDLRCLDDETPLDIVARYNRPALIAVDIDGERHTVLLTALDDKHATLVGENGTRDVPIAALQEHWAGRARIIWRADAGVRLIRPGSVGSAVVWLRDRLDTIDGRNPAARAGKPSPVYDSALGERVRAFQAAHGLKSDGLAGPRTQMMLNGAVASPGTPALRSVDNG